MAWHRSLYRRLPYVLRAFSGDATETALATMNREPKEDTLETVKPYINYLKRLGFSSEEREKLFHLFPGLEGVSFSRPLSEKLEFLAEKGMSRHGTVHFIANVLNVFPEFIDLDLLKDVRPVFRYLASLGLTDEEVLVMTIKSPHLVGYDVEAVFQPKVEFLRELGFDDRTVVKMINVFPQLFGVSLAGNIVPLVTYFTQEIGLGRQSLIKVFSKCPHLFGVRLSAIRAKLDLLIQTGFEMTVIRALMKRFPTFLRANLKEDLRPTIEILMEYTTVEKIRNIFYVCPQCLCLSYDQEILPKFRFLAQMGYDPVDLNVLLDKFPEVLCYSLEDEILPAVQKTIDNGLSLLEARIIFAREPDFFRQTIAKVTRDLDQKIVEETETTPSDSENSE